MNQSPTVFLIDDDADDQEIFNYALQKANGNAKCIFANDGLDALQKINENQTTVPDFIFIDMNMPRMNGQQCLEEIKRINRYKDVPIFMYSTSIDPMVMEENRKLGATDFITKPSDVNILTEILSRILSQKLFLLILLINILPQLSFAQDTLPPIKDLKNLSVEDLMNINVTSVSRTPEKLTEVPSAIQVITGDEIRRAAVTRLPGALRLATNLQVAQSGSHDWGITARGFNGIPVSSSSLANKLLVLIDGRSVYTPLFGGVFWDVQNVMMEDVDRIEVISGPGGTLWGANAVNGVVNVISKSAKETQGLYLSLGAGTLLNNYEAVRSGSKIGSNFFYRVYAQRFDFNSTTLKNGDDAKDAWNMMEGGFRMDYLHSKKDNFTLQGNWYSGTENDTSSVLVDGQNILGRWTHDFSDKSQLTVQSYFDRTYRNIQAQQFIDELTTYDIDVQHSFFLGELNHITWGVGYRIADDKINSFKNDFDPAQRTLNLLNSFVQDQFTIIPRKLVLTIGTKILYNDYTKVEYQPSARLAFTPNSKNTIWTAVSKAVRTPSRFDADNVSAGLGSDGDFKSENVIAYEAGYRVHPFKSVYFSLATFYNTYTDLRSADTNRNAPPVFYWANNLEANTYGIELSANIGILKWWRLRGGYTYLKEEFKIKSKDTYPQTYLLEAIDPQNQFLLQSIMDLPKGFQFDGTVRYVDVLPKQLNGNIVPSYITFDIIIGWQYKWLNLAFIGSNLADKNYTSFNSHQVSRRVMLKISVKLD